MITSLPPTDLSAYTFAQVRAFQPDAPPSLRRELASVVPDALERLDVCFGAVADRYYRNASGAVYFSHLHSDQYAAYLYVVSRELAMRDQDSTAERIYLLNKYLHALDVWFEVELPTHFFLSHPVGTVLGRAAYGDFFCVHQGCTVGGNNRAQYPVLGEHVTLYANSSVLGEATLGDYVRIGQGARIIDVSIPSAHTVYRSSSTYAFRPWEEAKPAGHWALPFPR